MTKINNPFIFGGPVNIDKFVGRANEVNRVFDQLASHARGSVAIIGERRIGKTSLMHYVSAPDVSKRWNLDEAQSLFIFQDCGAVSPFTITNFWNTILRRLRARAAPQAGRRDCSAGSAHPARTGKSRHHRYRFFAG